jgi:hypothetical protein
MKNHLRIAAFVVCVVVSPTFSEYSMASGDSKIDPNQTYLVLDTIRESTMQKELDEASQAGFRVIQGVGNTSLLLKKLADSGGKYEYLMPVVDEKQLNEAGAKGYRVVAESFNFRRSFSRLVVERAPGESRQYQYRALGTVRGSTLENELADALKQGYAMVGLSAPTGLGKHLMLMEKVVGATGDAPVTPGAAASSASGDIRLLKATKRKQEELDDAAAKGYRVVLGSDVEPEFVLQESVAGQARQYLVLGPSGKKDFQKELDDAAAKGFRLNRRTLGRTGYSGDEFYCVMEQGGDEAGRHEYLLLMEGKPSKLQTEIAEAAQKGYEVAAMAGTDYNQLLVLLEKPAQ